MDFSFIRLHVQFSVNSKTIPGPLWPWSKLRLQSVPIITKYVSSNPTHSEVYSIQHYVTKYESWWVLPPIKLITTI